MAQICRVFCRDVFSVVRSYSSQRKNYYEILNVLPNASQKDIRRAFIKLSKQLHPDISGKKSHVDFVKLNEAYSVLGKEHTRRQYDMQLQYGHKFNENSYTYTDPYTFKGSEQRKYGSRWEYEVRTAGGPWPPPNLKPDKARGLIIALVLFVLGCVQLFSMVHSARIRRYSILQNEKIERRYQHIHEKASANPESLHNLDELDLNQFFADDKIE